MNSLTKIVTVVLFTGSIGLFAYLYYSVETVVETRNAIEGKERAVINRLKLIREAEIVFREVHGRYTANWDSLSNFVASGQVPLIERREEIIQKAYGGEDVVIHIDTLGFIPAKERIFKKNYTLNASDIGTFVEFKAKVGDIVVKNQKAVTVQVGNRPSEQPFLEEGTIDSLAPLRKGDAVKKGQILITYWSYVFDPATDLKTLGVKPGTTQNFDIYLGKVDKSGSIVQTLEVKDPSPDNPLRKESNDQKARKPLRFGSRLDVTTAGNWE